MKYYIITFAEMGRTWDMPDDFESVRADIKDVNGNIIRDRKTDEEGYVYYGDVDKCFLDVRNINNHGDLIWITCEFALKRSASSFLEALNIPKEVSILPLVLTDKKKNKIEAICLFSAKKWNVVDVKNEVFKGKNALLVKVWPLIESNIPNSLDLFLQTEYNKWVASENFKNKVESLGLTGFYFNETYFV